MEIPDIDYILAPGRFTLGFKVFTIISDPNLFANRLWDDGNLIGVRGGSDRGSTQQSKADRENFLHRVRGGSEGEENVAPVRSEIFP